MSSASEPAIAVGGGNDRQSFADSNWKQTGGTDTQFTQKCLHFGPHFFDWIEIRAIGRKIERNIPNRTQQIFNVLCMLSAAIIHNNNITLPQGRE